MNVSGMYVCVCEQWGQKTLYRIRFFVSITRSLKPKEEIDIEKNTFLSGEGRGRFEGNEERGEEDKM